MTTIIHGDSGVTFPDASTQTTALTTGAQVIAGTKTFSSPPIFASVPSVSVAQSMVRVNTANGYGSTNTSVRKFTNVTNGVNGCVIQGADISLTNDAALGAFFTINANGVYSISLYTSCSVAWDAYITLNSTTSSLASDLIRTHNSAAGGASAAAWTGYLASGAVIRMVGDGGAEGGRPTLLTVARVS